MNRETWPQIIKDVGFDFSWDNEKVWELDVPVTELSVHELVWHFDVPFFWEQGVYNLAPGDVLKNPEKYPDQVQRMVVADLAYPIDVMRNKGRWLVLDGLHRLMKASVSGHATVRVRKIPRGYSGRIQK